MYISTPEDAKRIVRAAKFHPEGERGVCRFVRAAHYSSTQKAEYFHKANQDSLTIIHIEDIEGINNLEKIVSVKGVDIIFIGPYDLSQSCGFPG